MQSIRCSPIISALIVLVIATGIGTSVMALTLYHAKAGNPIWWKDDVLYRVLVDSRPASHESDTQQHPEYPPFTLIYRDALAIHQSKIPERSVMEFYSSGLVDSLRPGARPLHRRVRVTTHEFFPMFEVPFLHGHGWSQSDDAGPSQVVVISSFLNDSLFGGGNNVGRTLTLSGHSFTVIGVLERWLPLPRFYDEAKDFGPADDLFIPFRWIESIPELWMGGFCLQTISGISGFKALAPSDCLSPIGIWVEMTTQRQRREFSDFLDSYAREQQRAGRFGRPINNRLVKVSTWLEMNDVVGNENRIHVALALVFLGICILNTLGLILAKFMSAAPLQGIRRALGATRADILRQHLMEVVVLGALAGLIGIGVAAAGLRLIRIWVFPESVQPHENPDFATIAQSLSHMDGKMILFALLLSLLAGLLAGSYPAWRIGRMAPATFLKIQ
ncbi:MAG TPA: ABC transporter permease [Steroidobacteraceae bacterium]